MRRLRFVREFNWPELISRKNCVLCKVMGLRVFSPSETPILVTNEQAEAAIKAGAAVEVKS